MIDNERRMTDLERYQSFKRALERPTFTSEDDARENMRAVDGEFRRFVIKESGALGRIRVCYCFISTNREGETSWAFNDEYTFSVGQMNSYKNRAALAVGLELVESM